VNDDRRRLDDFLAAVDDAGLIVRGGRTVFDADPLVVRTAKNIVTEISEATKRCRPPRPEPSVGSHGEFSPACETAPSTGIPKSISMCSGTRWNTTCQTWLAGFVASRRR